MLGEDHHGFVGGDLRVNGDHRSQSQDRKICPHPNRLCHSDTALAHGVHTAGLDLVERVLGFKALKDIDTWLSDCYQLCELVK
jgi:hypothetical protein